MNKDKALKLALEALEPLVRRAAPWGELDWLNGCKAITAIKEYMAQPEQKRPQNCGTSYCSCIECVMEPEQEPVAHPFEDKAVISSLSWAAGLIEQAYRAYGGHNGADSWLMNYADKQGERIRQADHREWEKVNGRWQVKETTPPQRTWVGLTQKDAIEIQSDVGDAPL